MLDAAEQASRTARRAALGEIGHLRVGFTGTAAFNSKVPDLLRRFREAFQQAELTLLEATSGVPLAELEAGRLDVALPLAHRLARRRQIALAELADESFVQVPREAGSTLFDDIVAACNAAGIQPPMAQPVPQMASAVTLVAAGLGVASRTDDPSPVVRNFLRLALG